MGDMPLRAAPIILSALVYRPVAVGPAIVPSKMPFKLELMDPATLERKNWEDSFSSTHTSYQVTLQNRTPTLRNRCQ